MRKARAPLQGEGGVVLVIEAAFEAVTCDRLLPENARSFEHAVAEKQEVGVPVAALKCVGRVCGGERR